MFRLDTKNDLSYFILYKNCCKYFKFSKRVNTLENVKKVLKELYKIDYEII